MLTGHTQNWLVDNLAFGLSLIPLILLTLLVLAARLEANRRRPAMARVRAYGNMRHARVRY